MNLDIRLRLDIWNNLKTRRLKRLYGSDGVLALLYLWTWTAQYKPDGRLGDMTAEEIAAVTNTGEEFVKDLVRLKLLDETDGGYIVHDWTENNPYAADSEHRSNKARFSTFARVYPDKAKELKAQGVEELTEEEYQYYKVVCLRTSTDNRPIIEAMNDRPNEITSPDYLHKPYTINQYKNIPPIPPKGGTGESEEEEKGFTFEEGARMWNTFATENGLQTITKLSDTRRKKFKARQKDFASLTPSGYTKEFWQRVLEGVKVKNNGWWLGKNDRGYKLEFDKLISKCEMIDRFITAVPPEQDSGGTWERIQNNGAKNISFCEAAQNRQTTGQL